MYPLTGLGKGGGCPGAFPKLSFEIILVFIYLHCKYDTCNSTVHMSSMEEYVVVRSQSLLPLFSGHRGVFLGLEGGLLSWACSLGTGAEMSPPRKREDAGLVPEPFMALL